MSYKDTLKQIRKEGSGVYDRYMLEYEIKRNGMDLNGFCDKMGFSRFVLYKRLNGKVQWSVSEINKAMEILHLSSPMGIFFAPEVSEEDT